MEFKAMQMDEITQGTNIEERSNQGLCPETLKHLAEREMEKNQWGTEEWSERLGEKGKKTR